jgi:hypothetical protein
MLAATLICPSGFRPSGQIANDTLLLHKPVIADMPFLVWVRQLDLEVSQQLG